MRALDVMKPDYTISLLIGLAFAISPGAAVAQGTPTKEKAADYPARQKLPQLELGAEYLVHSLQTSEGVIVVADYLVIDVAAFPVSAQPWSISSGRFSLKINGKKAVLFSQSPGMVAASMKYPDWSQHPTVIAQAGMGDANVTLGRTPHPGRFPGDGSADRPRRSPVPEGTAEVPESAPRMPIGEVCQRLALQEDAIKGPRSGYLYFPFSGKVKSIKSLELIYDDGEGTTASLVLM